jgi:hypothetical protein
MQHYNTYPAAAHVHLLSQQHPKWMPATCLRQQQIPSQPLRQK